MIRDCFRPFALVFLLFSAGACRTTGQLATPHVAGYHDPETLRCAHATESGECAYYSVSIIDLLAHASQYDQKEVQLVGYVVLEFEGNAVCLSREDALVGISANCLWLSLEEFDGSALRGFKEGYALVRGRFDATYGGHFGSHPGAIGGVNRLEAWSIP